MNLEESLKKYNREIYNDVIVNGKVIAKGARECSSRFKAIDEVVPQHGSILDIGCHLGYFTIQLAAKSKNRVMVGMEGNYQRAELAGQIANANGLSNVIILNNIFNEEIALRWSNSCEALNSIFFLNVLHHCKKEEITNIVNGAQKLAPQIIVETPHVDETSACGTQEHRETINAIQMPGYAKAQIANTETHTAVGMNRPMYLFSNNNWRKEVLRPHYYHYTPSKHKHKIDLVDGQFIHNKKVWANGVNLGTMVALNIVYPSKDILFEMIKNTLDAHSGALYDINLWNMIYTSEGIKLIDFNSRLEQKSTKEQALIKLSKQYDEMKKEGAKPMQAQNFKNWLKHIIVGLWGRYKS